MEEQLKTPQLDESVSIEQLDQVSGGKDGFDALDNATTDDVIDETDDGAGAKGFFFYKKKKYHHRRHHGHHHHD